MHEYSNSPEINGIVRPGYPASMETQKDEALVDSWVDFCYQIMNRGVQVYAYANNHFQGHGPATIAKFLELWAASGFGKIAKLEQGQRQQGSLFPTS